MRKNIESFVKKMNLEVAEQQLNDAEGFEILSDDLANAVVGGYRGTNTSCNCSGNNTNTSCNCSSSSGTNTSCNCSATR
ncbi:MAG: hypothetical protein IPH12_12000 [Saprospirales bacterium]|nr:hypothetical protein [Saprospirales bacterium]MBK8921091.1 hypothetical protein [Saprospirales bacterium]